MPINQPMARIPTRPLSYSNKDMAIENELLVDWSTGEIYTSLGNNVFVSVTQAVYTALTQSGEISQHINVVIHGGGEGGEDITVNLQAFADLVFEDLDDFREQLKKFAVIDETTGEVTINIENITVTDNKQFVSATEKDTWNNKAETIKFVTNVGTAWQGTEAPYTQEIQLSGILSTDEPIVDVALSDALSYATCKQYVEAWGSSDIYRITTHTDMIRLYTHTPTTIVIPIKLKVVR